MLRPASPPRRRAVRRLPALLPAALLLLLPACEDLGPERTRVLVRYHERAPLTRDRLVVTVRDGRRDYYFEGLDLRPVGDGWWEGRELRLAADGEADVLVAVRGAGVSPAAAGEILLPLAPNARWRLDVFASSADGPTACGGCTAYRRFGIVPDARPSAQDFLYVTWTSLAPRSGARRSHPPIPGEP